MNIVMLNQDGIQLLVEILFVVKEHIVKKHMTAIWINWVFLRGQ